MTAVNEQVVISVKDLRFATVVCRHCNTRVTLDLETELQSDRHKPFSVPKECPRCHSPFDSVLPGAVVELQQIYKALVGLKDAVTFTGVSVNELRST